ncbi:MAG: hypothetical protein ACEQR7_06060 [Agathobacter rectalis]
MGNNDNNLVPFQNGDDPRRNVNGRPKGSKNLATIIRELEDEQFDWSQIPIKDQSKLKKLLKDFGPVGSPFRVVVYKALFDSIFGKPPEKASAREWLRKAGYGDKVDVTSDGKRIQSPLIISTIQPRHVEPEIETEVSDGPAK